MDDLAGPSFRVLLYRYFFFAWLFKDVSQGNVFQRAAAWRHNVAQAHWLLSYLRRWAVLGAAFYLLGLLAENGLGADAWSALFYLPSALTVVVNAVIGVALAGFKLLPGPL